MKESEKNSNGLNGDEMIEFIEKILQEKGKEALEIAQNEVLQEKIESKQVHDALNYFMKEYWQDLTRPALISLICEAIGGSPELVKPVAASMIVISGGIDIHDDIIDESKIKESRQTVLGKFGKDIALLTGDALLFKGFTLLYKAIEKGIPPEKVTQILNITKNTFFKLGDAEALELKIRGRLDINPQDYIRLVRKKAADVEAYTRISGIIGGGSEEEINTLGNIGRLLGMINILRDDLIDMIDPREILHRIKKEHLPIPILYALQNFKYKSTLSSIILKKKMSKKDLNYLLEIVEKADGFKKLREQMENIANEIMRNLDKLRQNKKELKLLVKAILLPLDKLEI